MKQLWKFLLMLFLAAPVWAGTTALTGTILDASNNPATDGFVRFTVQPLLPNVVYRDTGTGLIIRTSSTCNIQSDGTILDVDNVTACTISDNSTLTPANSFYKIEVAPGGVVSDTFFAFVTGASADISSLTLASPSSALPPPSFAVATNPTVDGILTVENIVPKADSTYDLGTTTVRFRTLFVDAITGASVAQSGACATNLYVIAVNDGSAPTCLQPDFTQIQGVATDAQVNNNITLTNLTQVTTRLISDTTGTLLFSRGGTGQTTAPDDNILIGSGSAWALFVMPNCTDNVNEKLNYDAPTNAFECNSDQGAGAGGITTLNTLTASSQTFVVGTAGTDFVISSATSIHTFDLPDASATARGLVTSAAQTLGGTKTTPVWNASTGFQIGGAAASGNVLRGNATNFVSAQLNFSDLAGAATDAQVPDTITLTNLTQVTTRNFTAMQGTVTDIQLANNYSGVGVCAANQFVTGVVDNAAPNCAQPSFSNISGSATDAQIPNTITLSNITQITTRPVSSTTGDLAASRVDDGGAASIQALFSGAGGAAGFRAIVDGDVPNTITLNNLTQVTTRLISSTTGTLAVSRGGTNLTASANDNVMVGNGTTWETKAIADCNSAGNALNYDTTGNNFSCRTLADADIPNTITLTNLTQITTRNHSSLQGIVATDHHADSILETELDTFSKLQTQIADDTVLSDGNTATLTGKTYNAESSGNVLTTTSKIWMVAAGCNNVTPGPAWDIPTSNPAVPSCLTGTNTQKGYLLFADAVSEEAQINFLLPSDFTGNADVAILYSTLATSGNFVFEVTTECAAENQSVDPTWSGVSTVVDAVPGTANLLGRATISAINIAGCSANEWMFIRFRRLGANGSDTATSGTRFFGMEMTIRRAI